MKQRNILLLKPNICLKLSGSGSVLILVTGLSMPLMSHEIQFKELFVHSLLLVLGRVGPHVVQAFLTKTSFLEQFLSEKALFCLFSSHSHACFG